MLFASRSHLAPRDVSVSAFVLLMFAPVYSFAASPIEFDVAATVAVQDITTQSFAATHPQEKMIAVRLPVSVFVSPRASSEASDYIVTFDTASDGFQVEDFFPKTALDSRIATPVNVRMAADRQLAVDFDATGFYKHLTGAALTGSLRDASKSQADFQMKAPQELVSASGTIQRGRGVYFKLRPSPDGTLEGAKEFLIIARVPRSWRGDAGRVRCSLVGNEHQLLSIDETQMLQQRDFLVGLYLEGDSDAQTAAQRLIHAEQRLRDVAASQKKQLDRQATPKLLRKVGFTTSSPAMGWLEELRFAPARPEQLAKMPPTVRDAAMEFASARASMHQLSGQRASYRTTASVRD